MELKCNIFRGGFQAEQCLQEWLFNMSACSICKQMKINYYYWLPGISPRTSARLGRLCGKLKFKKNTIGIWNDHKYFFYNLLKQIRDDAGELVNKIFVIN
jgi:hypothetical protein